METSQWMSMVTIPKAKGKNIISSYLHIIVFIWPFLPFFSPLTSHNRQVFLGLPGLNIVQNPHAHCANHEKHYVMRCAWYRPLCACFAACSEALGCPNSSQAPHWAQWPVHSIIHFHIIADIPKAADKARKRFVSGIH